MYLLSKIVYRILIYTIRSIKCSVILYKNIYNFSIYLY